MNNIPRIALSLASPVDRTSSRASRQTFPAPLQARAAYSGKLLRDVSSTSIPPHRKSQSVPLSTKSRTSLKFQIALMYEAAGPTGTVYSRGVRHRRQREINGTLRSLLAARISAKTADAR